MNMDPRQKITPDQMANVMEQLTDDVPLKAIAYDLGVDVSTLQRRIQRAEAEGFEAFKHPAHRIPSNIKKRND